jgi:hypothetical protein
MSTTRNMPKHKGEESFGLAAIGSDGGWEVALDETTSGAQKWFAQIEGHSVYLYFAVRSPAVIGEMLDFFTTPSTENALSRRSTRNGRIIIGNDKEAPVTLVRDDEFADRYFLVAETKGALVARLTIGGADLTSIVNALRQAKEDLD